MVLSKEYHPDTNISSVNKEADDARSNQEFIQVMEAYQVLSKAHSRANYDLSLKGIDTVNYIRRDTIYEPWRVDPTSYSEKGPNYSPYYGIKGIKKVANWKIVMACVIFCAVGVLMQVLAITRSITFKRDQLDRSSAIYQESHDNIRNNAAKHTRAEQLEYMRLRLKKSYLDPVGDEK